MKSLRFIYGAQQTGPTSLDYPYGTFRNRQFDGDPSGTPVEAQWANDVYGMMCGILKKVNATASGSAETAQTSQVADAIETLSENKVLRGSYSWPNGTQSGIGVWSDEYAIMPNWGFGINPGGSSVYESSPGVFQGAFSVDRFGIQQMTRSSSPIFRATVVQPPGRWKLTSMRARVTDFDLTPSISPLKISLKRRELGTNSISTLGTIQYGGTGGETTENTITALAPGRYMPGGHLFYYYVEVEGEQDASDAGAKPKIDYVQVLVQFDPYSV
jgi:hypothetical protein